jgi:hypothetical protein
MNTELNWPSTNSTPLVAVWLPLMGLGGVTTRHSTSDQEERRQTLPPWRPGTIC